MNSGSEDLANAYPLSGISGTNYNVTVFISNDVCVVYVNDKLAFSNCVYNIVNKKNGVFLVLRTVHSVILMSKILN
ncbi:MULTISPECIES: glycoside hydrolase domain-containing protein [Chryseobacterium]|nr:MULTISPECIES: glycoside hydrolase domain-containing protein [Chryseobacterium]